MIEKKILVTYFTASEGRVTERVAKNLAAAVSGDIFEIAAKDRYTKADIRRSPQYYKYIFKGI